jgi:hypothetical protein
MEGTKEDANSANGEGVESNYRPASLHQFFIFTPKNVPEGMEHEKLLYFFPESVAQEEKNRKIGLSEAFVHFTGYQPLLIDINKKIFS